ncbi:hypothetical protein PHMEG_00035265 [Phytophthora megakarya]|uniref:Uncharacterized protein n=1 Tax=Phytophthora megakarya TaxID=4795 RepID=A0A225UP41_9STRA|nr:hypothetical protein PHMEG_00035265 [Phytophthora megakarya]
MATEPWCMLGQRRPTPLTFDHNLHRRASTPLWRIAVLYAALEEDHMIAYSESTHYLEITKAMADADSDLFTYHQDRRLMTGPEAETVGRMSPSDEGPVGRYRRPVGPLFPTSADSTGLGTLVSQIGLQRGQSYAADSESPRADRPDHDPADPWRNHYRDPGPAHPSLQIPRLVNKFNPPPAP